MPRADWKVMQEYARPIPPDSLAASFHTLIEPIVAVLGTLTHQNRRLRHARDLLLPRLMSGEIEV